MILNEFIENIIRKIKEIKKKDDLILIFSSPDEIIVKKINRLPERKIEKKHQGHDVFKTCSRIKMK